MKVLSLPGLSIELETAASTFQASRSVSDEAMIRLVLRKSATAIRLLRESPRELLRKVLPRFESYEIISTPVPPERLDPPLAGLAFRELTDEEVLSAARSREEFAPGANLLGILGRSHAYGAFLDGTLVAMVWLIAYGWAPPGVRLLSLREGEAERGQGTTLTEHRGKGIVPWVLSELSSVAFGMGLRELLGIIATNNAPALRAVQKIGGQKRGRIYRLIGPPFLGFRQWVIRREIRR